MGIELLFWTFRLRRLLDMGISGVLLDDESGGGGRIQDRDASVELSRYRCEIKGHEATREGAPQELGGGGAEKPLPAAHPGHTCSLLRPCPQPACHSAVLHSPWPRAQAPHPLPPSAPPASSPFSDHSSCTLLIPFSFGTWASRPPCPPV